MPRLVRDGGAAVRPARLGQPRSSPRSSRSRGGSVSGVDPYQGPPPTTPPPYGWQPPRVVEPAAPRILPAQDHAAIDADEERARNLTKGIGIIAAAGLTVGGYLMAKEAGELPGNLGGAKGDSASPPPPAA